jgi:alkylation response protein AidB-like acyl-CoA dehydrogenase
VSQVQEQVTRYADVLEGVRKVAAKAAERAIEIDELRAFPDDLYDELEATRVFDAPTPKALGGLELSLRQVADLIVEGARGNGSLGWLLMIGSAQGIGFGNYPEASARRLLEEFPQLRTRGVFAPKGKAIPTDGGYRVTGQWPFASGGPNPNYVSGNCLVFRDGAPSVGPDGNPEMVMTLMPAQELQWLDTWHVFGMRGTDSRDFVANDVFVPKDMTTSIFERKGSFFGTPVASLPIRVALATPHAAVAVGIALGALDDITEMAKTKRAAMNPSALLADDPIFRHTLGEQTLRLTGARAMMNQVTEDNEHTAAQGRSLTPTETLVGRSMAAYVTAECVKVVDAAYSFGGSSPVYDGSSLQRRLRDIHVATQHIGVSPEAYRILAAAVLGEELSARDLF